MGLGAAAGAFLAGDMSTGTTDGARMVMPRWQGLSNGHVEMMTWWPAISLPPSPTVNGVCTTVIAGAAAARPVTVAKSASRPQAKPVETPRADAAWKQHGRPLSLSPFRAHGARRAA